MAAAAIAYPVVAKPDIGCNGTGVRLLRGRDDLARYLAEFPRGERVMLQEFVADEGEAGIFYVRHPDEASGRITSITLKHAPVVIGDGRSTLRQLMLADPRAGRVPQLYLPRLARRLHEVPRQGERVRLVFVGNHCKGSIFEDGTHLATPALTQAFERIARAMPGFHFGRIDVRFASLPALLRGEGFRIIEINGAGSEATHIWDREHHAARGLARAVLPLWRGVPHRRGEPRARPPAVRLAGNVPAVAATEAADGGLSDERLTAPLPNPAPSVRNAA